MADDWPKPGPGTWLLDRSHAGAAPGPIQRSLYERPLAVGTEQGFRSFGAPLKTMEMRWVNGRFYRRLVPLVGGSRDLPPPPPVAVKLLSRVHPAFRRAERRAKETFETKRWREEIARWESEWKPNLIARNSAYSDVDVSALDDAALASHVGELYDHVLENATLHFRLHVSDLGPLGNLMIHLEDWGLHRDDAFRALIDASPATREPAAQLRAVAAALRDAGIDPATITSLDDVRAVPVAAATLDEYLRLHGLRMTTGYDIEDRYLLELPDVIVTSIRGAATQASSDRGELALQSIAALREQVPPSDRVVFDEVVEDARSSYGLRDENGPLTYEWPAGLLRRAVVEAGRRLGLRDRVFELDMAEVTAMLRGAPGPGDAEIDRRAAERRAWAAMDAPDRLGPEEAPPPVDSLPPNLARLTRVVLTVVESLEAMKTAPPLVGMGIGTDTYVGTARVVHDAIEALSSVEPGDVIVTPYTAPTYNAVLSMAGAIVTEEGGLLCHAAVIARELGLPAVIGATDAMRLIPDGARVEVDAVAGAVRVL